MRLITATDLTYTSDLELERLIREYADRLRTTDATSYDYAVLRDSLAIMKRVQTARRKRGPRL